MPYDRFVREMLTASGSNFRKPQVNFYRAVQSRQPQAIAQAVALSFMGVQSQKAGPRSSAFGRTAAFLLADRLSSPPANGRRRSFCSISNRRSTEAAAKSSLQDRPRIPMERAAKIVAGPRPPQSLCQLDVGPREPLVCPQHCQPRLVLAAWAAASFIRRTTSGRTTRPSVRSCLSYLEQELVSVAIRPEAFVPADPEFRRPISVRISRQPKIPGARRISPAIALRRLEAEVLIDALCQISWYEGAVFQHYSRALHVLCPRISGRWQWPMPVSPARSWKNSAGRRATPVLASDRSNRTTAAQRLHMLNSSHIRRKIEGGPKMQPLDTLDSREGERRVHRRALSDDSFAVPDGGGVTGRENVSRNGLGAPEGVARSCLGANQWPGVFLPTLVV